MTVPCARRREHLRPGFRREEQLLEIGLRHFLKPSPLRNREKHCRFDAAPGHDLRPFPGTRVEKLTEPGLGFLNLPSSAHDAPRVNATDRLYDHLCPAARRRRAEAEPTTDQRSGNSVLVTAIRTDGTTASSISPIAPGPSGARPHEENGHPPVVAGCACPAGRLTRGPASRRHGFDAQRSRSVQDSMLSGPGASKVLAL